MNVNKDVCPICGREISTNNIERHVKSHETHPEYQKQLLNHPSMSNPLYDGDKMICRFCGKIAKNLNSYRQHEIRCKLNPNHIECINNLAEYTKTHDIWNKGKTKETDERVKKYAETQKADYGEWINVLNDDGKLHARYVNKRSDARIRQIEFQLTFEQYCLLVKEAGLVSSQLGYNGKNYVLARYEDSGPYAYGNCRFTTQLENMHERKVSDCSRQVSSENMRKLRAEHSNMYIVGTSEHEEWLEALRNSDYNKKRKAQAEQHKKEIDAKKDKRYCGEHNSQLGTFWITDGETNMKWSESKGELPVNYYRGRVTTTIATKSK